MDKRVGTDSERELVKVWRGRIRVAQDRRSEFKKITERTEAAFRGELRPDPSVWAMGDPWVSVEKVHSSIRAALPTMLYSNPKWSVTPKRPIVVNNPQTGQATDISWELARSKELWLNHVWEQTQGNKHARVAIVAAFLGFGAMKVGYLPLFEDNDERGEFELDTNGQLILDGGTGLPRLAKGDYLRDEDGAVIFDDTGMPLLDPGPLLKEEFFAEYCHYDNFLFDPEGGNVFETSHRWIIEEWVRPLEHVKDDPRYKPEVRRNIAPTRKVGDKPGMDPYVGLTTKAAMKGVEKSVDDDEARVRGFDIYDFENRRYLVLVEETVDGKNSNNRFLMDRPLPVGLNRGPFFFLRFNEVPGQWYPKPDAEGMAKLELEYNITRSQGMLQRKNSRPRWLEQKGKGFDGEDGGDLEREKFLDGPSHSIAMVRSVEGVRAAEMPQIDATHYQALPLIAADFNEVAGQPGGARGVADADTATEASILAGTSEIRNNDRRDNIVQKFLAEIGNALLVLGQANATGSIWAKVERPGDPQPFDFAEIKPEYLQGDFDVQVAMGSTQPKNSAARVAMLERIITAISQNPVIAAAPTLMRRVFESLDISDENLFAELQQIGQMAMQGMAGPPGAASGGGEQVIGDILSAVGMGNAAAGNGTGAPIN